MNMFAYFYCLCLLPLLWCVRNTLMRWAVYEIWYDIVFLSFSPPVHHEPPVPWDEPERSHRQKGGVCGLQELCQFRAPVRQGTSFTLSYTLTPSTPLTSMTPLTPTTGCSITDRHTFEPLPHTCFCCPLVAKLPLCRFLTDGISHSQH